MRIVVITGPMFSGKSDELIRRLERHSASWEVIKTFVHKKGVHHGDGLIASRTGRKFAAKSVRRLSLSQVSMWNVLKPTIVAVDEAQFFSEEEVRKFLRDMRPKDNTFSPDVKEILFAGLDTDFRGEPFGPMGYLLAIADEVVKLTWVCAKCGSSNGTKTQRLNRDGSPASYYDDVSRPGDSEMYETRCFNCHEVRDAP